MKTGKKISGSCFTSTETVPFIRILRKRCLIVVSEDAGVRFQHPVTQWNLRGGRWSSVENSTKKEKNPKNPTVHFVVESWNKATNSVRAHNLREVEVRMEFNPILHTWLRNSCFTCDNSPPIQVFPFDFLHRYGKLNHTKVLLQMGDGLLPHRGVEVSEFARNKDFKPFYWISPQKHLLPNF